MKSMKRTILVLGILVGLMGFMSAGAQATVINGTIGGYLTGNLDNTNLSLAAKIDNISPLPSPYFSGTGDFTGLTSVQMVTTITFKPTTPTINNFITFSTVGGKTYVFSVTSMDEYLSPSKTSVTISGLGDMVSGADTTVGHYSITINQSAPGAPVFYTMEIDSPAVPEPSTLLLFGTGLLGLGFFGRRKKSKA